MAAIATTGCIDDEAGLLASAHGYIDKQDPVSAKLQLKTVLQRNPQSGEARFLLGKVLLDSGDAAGADAELRRALDAGWPKQDVLPVLASTLLAEGKGGMLVEQYGHTDLADPTADAELKAVVAGAYLAQGALDSAETTVAAALRRDSADTSALVMQARVKLAQGDATGALALADRMPPIAAVWALKGDALLQGEGGRAARSAQDAAAAAYRNSLALKADQPAIQSALMTLLLGQHDVEGARAQWEQMRKALPQHPQTLFYEAVLADQRGDALRTREITQQLLRASPDNPRVLLLAGQAELKLGSLAPAEALLGKAVLQAPNAAAPRRILAETQLREGQPDRALATLAPLLDAATPDAEALTLAGQAQMASGNAKAANASFAHAAKIEPDDARVRLELALSQFDTVGHDQDAAVFSELERLAATDKDNRVDLALIGARMHRNDLKGALKAVDSLAAKQPALPLADQLRGRILLRGGDAVAARKSFEQAVAKDATYLPALAALAALDLADKQPDAARERFTALLAKEPRNASAMLALAVVSARSGDKPEVAQGWLERAVKIAPDNALAHLRLIDHFVQQRQPGPALNAAQTAVAVLPENTELLDRLGSAELMSGDRQQAVATFTKLAGLLPKSPEPRLRLADAKSASGDAAGAAAAVRSALEVAPDAPSALQAGITLAMRDGKPDEALALSRKLRGHPAYAAFGYQLEGDIEANRANWDASIAAYRMALAKAPSSSVAQRLHSALVSGGRSAEAERLASAWTKDHPDDSDFVLHQGDLALQRNQFAEAERHYRALLERKPNHLLALNNLAYVLAIQKKPGAVALAEKAVQLSPGQPALMDTLSFSLAAEQQLPKALELEAKVVALAPDAPQFRLQLAKMELQSGDKPAAREELGKLAKLGPGFARQAEVAELLKSAGS